MDKQTLRATYKVRRASLDLNTIEDLSLQIANQALKLPIWDKTYYHIFLSIRAKQEVDTSYLLHILQGRDKSIAVPKVQFEQRQLQSFLLQENTKLRLSDYGVPEPEDGIEIPPEKMDVVFVPLLAYDKQGNRLGYGMGFYDRFLSQCRSDCIFVGLSFFPPENTLTTGEHDIPLDYCVTPSTFYTF